MLIGLRSALRVLVKVICFRDVAVQQGGVATITFQLQRGVLDVVFVKQNFVNSVLERRTRADR